MEASKLTNFDDDVNTLSTGRQLAGDLAPISVGLVIDDNIGAESLQALSLCVG